MIQNERLAMFERYIHTNSCSDEGGWFAYFCPDGDATDAFEPSQEIGLYVNGCATEEEAIQRLCHRAFAIAEAYAE